MKVYAIFFPSLIALTLLFSSCEKVIDLPLSSASPQIVIQGNIYDEAGPYTVTLSKSVPFDQSNVYPAVTGATVSINDDAGHSETLTETDSGTYVTSSLQGVAGRTYTLTVKAERKTYLASSTMPPAVGIDSMYVENLWGTNDKMLTVTFMDPANIKNYYHLVEFLNGEIVKDGFYVGSDRLNEGKKVTYSMYSDKDEYKLDPGKKVTIWLECIDKGVYDYFRSADTNSNESASPANPTSNISNGALGYFNACSMRSKTIIAQ